MGLTAVAAGTARHRATDCRTTENRHFGQLVALVSHCRLRHAPEPKVKAPRRRPPRDAPGSRD